MLNIGGGELLIIFLVALIVLGPGKLPEAARQAGQVMREFRRISSGFQRELKQAMDDPVAAATKSATTTTVAASAKATDPVDVTEEPELPPIAAPDATAAFSGDDPETRQARAESIASATPATPINRLADPFAPREQTTPDPDETEGLASDR